ncbi:MAG: DUF11 domain-containing protein [Candidatus Lokiarchaeota archaeon]|nr:DUF11 domain-containing protein [Candidatus Lokiarchaeota archaeon]
MKTLKRSIKIILILIILIAPLYFNINLIKLKSKGIDENKNDFLRSTDIAGTDLYAEQIEVYVAGNKSIIKQSLFSNDTNIFSQFDLNDPAFYKCNVLISASNTLKPDIFPIPLTESMIPDQFASGFNRFVGFLYYDDEVISSDANSRAERALEIIRRKFQIDLIIVNVSEPNFFPFVGDYPDWALLLNELTNNLPMDGYWKALDLSRLTSEEYFNNHHLSSTFIILNSLNFFEGDFEITTSQLDFSINSLDLSFLENIENNELIEQFNNILDNYGEILNATISEDELEQFFEILNSFTLLNNSHYTNLVIQYEGLPEGISEIKENQYRFDLWDAIGYHGEPLAPSEKIYIALVGAFMTDIEINILCTEIVDTTPVNFEFYDYLLEQIGLIFYLAGIEFDIQALKEYSFELYWVNEEGFKNTYIKPVNVGDPYDIVNLLQQLGFKGFSYIPTGIVNPFEDFSITYNISNSEPNLLLRKELVGDNASYGAFRDFSYYISAENVGNTTSWGYPTPIPLELNDFFLLLTLGNQPLADELNSVLWDVIRIEYPNQYSSLEDFFNFDEDPLIFYFDSLGTGVYDTFFPDILDFTNLWPYNDKIENIIDIIVVGYPQLISTLAILGLSTEDLRNIFTNNNSIWNDENWKIEPGNNISYYLHNVSISEIDSFTPIFSNNFTIGTDPQTPEIIYGTSINGTIPEMALSMDTEKWVIESVERLLNQRIELNFVFRNDTLLDLKKDPLEMVSIIINFSAPDSLDSLDFEIYNFELEEFENLEPYLTSFENNSWKFSIVNNNNSLDWLFYPLEQDNHTMLFKLRGIDSDNFNISINDLDVEFSTRDININEDSGSRVVYGSSTGNVQYERRSNSISLSNYDMASIILTSSLDSYSSKEGDLNNYHLNLKNIGSRPAENISISLKIPGIVGNTGNFILENGNLTHFISKLEPFENRTINFSFYVPNTRTISEISITYNNPKNVQGGISSEIVTLTNEVYVSAPLDYENKFPFVRLLEIKCDYDNTLLNQSLFNFTYSLKSFNPNGIKTPDINISIYDQIGDLRRVDTNDLYFEDLEFNETISFNITISKTGWRGYYYPAINYIESSEAKTIQILSSSSSILGVINFSITKYVDKEHIRIGEEITVFIEVKNTGTLKVEDITVRDTTSYSQSDFMLINGKLINLINSLEPGEIVSINYTIRARKQGIVTLKPAFLEFYYLYKLELFSNNVFIKVNSSPFDQSVYIIVAGIVAITILLIYYSQNSRYKKSKDKLERREKLILKMDSREAIMGTKPTLRDQLRFLSRSTKEKNDVGRKL